ncbi:ATP-binding cassette domain-containing protein [Leptolyngbya sp. 15MV]|nr:ATP-binding cassette domain-containing protein [Leptolyngbya sp. 15MV]
MAQVSIRQVVKAYEGGVQAVKGIDLEIADHEFVVLVGPSGCGKSTTLRMIAGLEEITAGEIAIGGTVVNDIPPRDRDIAMVFQNYALYPHMSVWENMAFGLTLRKFPKDEIKRRVENAARILDITPLLERKPKALSGGQRQRILLARALYRRPRVLLMDEGTSHLDVAKEREVNAALTQLSITRIVIAHRPETIAAADRVLVLREGRLHAPPRLPVLAAAM